MLERELTLPLFTVETDHLVSDDINEIRERESTSQR